MNTASRIQVQTEWNVSLDFFLFFFKMREINNFKIFFQIVYLDLRRKTALRKRENYKSHRDGTRRESLQSPGKRRSPHDLRSAASAAIPARDLTFTVTQGNQLRNKLSFYRILNLASHPGWAWIIKGPKREASLPPPPRKKKISRDRTKLFVAYLSRVTRGRVGRQTERLLWWATAASSKSHLCTSGERDR